MTDFPTLSDHILQLVKSLPSHIHVLKPPKGTPFGRSYPKKAITESTPSGDSYMTFTFSSPNMKSSTTATSMPK